MLDDLTFKALFVAGFLVVASLFLSGYLSLRVDPGLAAIPTAGYSDPILSYISAAQFTFDGIRMLKEGYEKTRPGLFKIASFRRWIVLAAGHQLIDDIRSAPDDVLSLLPPANEFLQPDYTLKLMDPTDEYHTDIIRSKLTRDVAGTFKEVHEELSLAMDDLIPPDNRNWVKVPISDVFPRVICRTMNRILVGTSLCRDHDYQALNLTFAANVLKFGFIISLFPKPLRPIASRLLSNLPQQTQQQIEILRPIVEERLAMMEEHGEQWDDKPNDMLMWLMSEAKGVEKSLEGWARRLLLVNVIGIHSTALTVTQVVYRLLANPECIGPLRQEVDAIVSEEGWTKAGIDKMHKIDSFLRETQRIDSFTALAVNRCALRPFTFSNGITVPAGTFVSVPANATHRDERIYANADEFDGFRFIKLRESEGDITTSRYQAVSVSNEHLPFGLGRHTCPGRFFAVNEVKALLAHIVTIYDIKFAEGQGVPRERFLSGLRYPGRADVMFRARQK